MTKRVASALVALVALLIAPDARAKEATARLTYVLEVGAEACPDAPTVRAAVAEALGYDPFTASPDAPTLSATLHREGNLLRANVQLVDHAGNVLGARELQQDAAHCDELVKLVVLSMSIALDPEALDRPRRAEAKDTKRGVNVGDSQGPRPPAISPREPVPPRERIHLEMGAAPAAWIGAGPAPSFGALAFVAARYGIGALAIEGRHDLPASRRFASGIVETSLTAGALVPCAHWSVVELCGVGALGSLRARSREVSAPKEASSLHALAGVRVGVNLPLVVEALWLWAHADGLAALTAPSLTLSGAEIYALPRLSGGMAAGLRVRFR